MWRPLLLVLGAQALLRASRDGRTEAEDDPVDVVIPCSLESDASLTGGKVRVQRERDNGELQFTLRSIQKNAPWVRRIFLLMNGPQQLPAWAPEPAKTTVVDRCTLLGPTECPTRNGFAVQTVVHKVPGLAERFIYTDDDNVLLRPSTKETFFDQGVPRYYAWGPPKPVYWYTNSALPSPRPMMLAHGPTGYEHVWVPLTKTVCSALETKYPQFFSFVRSHKEGRYSSMLGTHGTERAEQVNSVEESFHNIWWWQMQTSGKGSMCCRDLFTDHGSGGLNDNPAKWRALAANPPTILNINDNFEGAHGTATYDPQVYERQKDVFYAGLERLLPAQRLLLLLEGLLPPAGAGAAARNVSWAAP